MARGKIVYGRKNRYFVDDREVTRAEYDRTFPNRIDDILSASATPDGHRSSCWPLVSDACAVHPDQAQQATDRARTLGVPTEFRPDGRPVFVSQGHRREYARKVERMVDRNGCYGDPT